MEEEGSLQLHLFAQNAPVGNWDFLGLDPNLPSNGESGYWIGGQGNGVYVREGIWSKYGKGVKFYDGQPDFGKFANGQVVEIKAPFDLKSEYKTAVAEMKTRNPNWARKKDWEWHHFEGNGRRELQYVPQEVNRAFKHTNPTVSTLRQKARQITQDFRGKVPGNAAKVISLTGILLAGAESAANADEDVQAIHKNMDLYIQAKEIGEPTSAYSEEIAMGYYDLFCNELYFYAILWYLEGKAGTGGLP